MYNDFIWFGIDNHYKKNKIYRRIFTHNSKSVSKFSITYKY